MALLLFGGASRLAYTQTLVFANIWGGTGYDKGNGVAVDGSGNVYVTGETNSYGAGACDVALLKYDSSGILQWQKTWGTASSEVGNGVAVDGSGNVYVTGFAGNFLVLLKFDPSGVLLWQKTWGGGGDIGRDVAVDGSGNVYVTGDSYGFGLGNGDIVVLKFNSSGALLWQKTWGTSASESATGVTIDGTGDIYVSGYTSGWGLADFVILKFDPSGASLWQKTWGSTDTDYGYGIAVDGTGNIYVTGRSHIAGKDTIVLLKLDTSGTLLWKKAWGPATNQGGYDVAVGGLGNIYVTGFEESQDFGVEVAVLKFFPSGDLAWVETWGSPSHEFGYAVAVDGSGDACVTGYVAGPIYGFTSFSDSDTLTAPPGAVSGQAVTLGAPPFTPGTPLGTVGTPSGSETYAGTTDLFMLKLSSQPVTVTIAPKTTITEVSVSTSATTDTATTTKSTTETETLSVISTETSVSTETFVSTSYVSTTITETYYLPTTTVETSYVTTTTTEMLTTATTSLLTTTSSVTTTETTTSGTTTTMTITVGTGTPSCLGAGGGHSVGFWTSKDGQTKVNDDGGAGAELALLAGLNLKNADGSDFSPASYNELKSWLQKANSPNMAYKLSSALAVMALNVEAGFVDGSSPVYAPGVPGANASGFISITDLMNTANSALGNDGYTPSGDTNRLVQEVMLKALDDANNNTNFANHAHSTPTGC